MHHYSATLGPLPAGKQVLFQANVELIEHPVDGLVDNIIQALRPMVEGRHRRHNHRPQLRGLHQQTQMAKTYEDLESLWDEYDVYERVE